MSRPKCLRLDELEPKQRLAFLAFAMHDQMFARSAATFAARYDPAVELQRDAFFCFSEIAVVRYMRPFKYCRLPYGAIQTRLDRQIVSEVHPDPSKASAFHAGIDKLRDQIVTHSDLTDRGLRLSPVRNQEGYINPNAIQTVLNVLPLTRSNMSALASLASALETKLRNEILPIVRELYPNILDKGEDVWILGQGIEEQDITLNF